MQLASALRTLWLRRPLVLLVALAALAVAVLMTFRLSPPATLESRQYTVGIGSATALVDTPSSQIIDLGGEDATADVATLAGRAALLASVMTSSPIKDEIATRAGIDADKLTAIPPPSGGTGGGQTEKPANVPDAKAYILKTSIPNLESGELPMIVVATQAPTEQEAARLANESLAVLKTSLASAATSGNVPNERRLVVRPLGTARFATQTRGPARMLSIVAALFVFALGCGTILGISALIGDWRKVSELEKLSPEEREAYERRVATAVATREFEPEFEPQRKPIRHDPPAAPSRTANGNGNGNGKGKTPHREPSNWASL